MPAFHVCHATLVVRPGDGSAELVEGAYATAQTAPDPNDADNSNPRPVIHEVCDDVDVEGDAVHARLGFSATWFGVPIAQCVDQDEDGPLPVTLPVPVPTGLEAPD